MKFTEQMERIIIIKEKECERIGMTTLFGRERERERMTTKKK